ncbi:CHAT domain-containing protein [Russula earlei]|uniref:CHAT domain-containing protein n=1 Tax=Russula earlei TaxID=71964 RepID=A0ACC0UD98_9AGAM|nr:CHAT domain-containing protein [Russula earlei]
MTCCYYPDTILVAFPVFKAWQRDYSDTFFSLLFALSLRSHESRQPEHVKWSIRGLRYLLNQPLDSEAFNIPTEMVTSTLAEQFKLQTVLEPDATMGDVEEMAVRCHELLNSDISKTLLVANIMALVCAVDGCTRKGVEWRAHSEKVIECLREANRSLPDLPEISIALAQCLYRRFEMAISNDDHEEGMAVLDKIIAFPLPPPEDRSSECLQKALQLVASFASTQWSFCGKSDYLEKEIHRFRSFLDGVSPEDPIRSVVVEQLSRLREMRQSVFAAAGLRGTHSIDSDPVPPFRDLITALSQSSGGSKVADDQPFNAIVLTRELTNVEDIEPAIEYYRLVIASYHPNSQTTLNARLCLGEVLYTAFSFTHDIRYLDESISVLRDLLTSMVQSRQHYGVIATLSSCLYRRFCWLHHKEDIDEVVQLLRVAVHHESVNIQHRFEMSCHWARIAHMHGHPSVLMAYDISMSFMQETLTFAPTLDTQHFQLVTMRQFYEVLPLDYASYLIHTGRLHQAIEILEQGRALLWSEMRGLRISVDQLRAANSHLADKIAALNKDLETIMLTISLTSNVDGDDQMDRIGLLQLQQKKLLDERDTIISQVRDLPGFQTFLKTPSFGTLSLGALRGPVVIINHSEWRSDILILLHNASPSLIPTSKDFYYRAIELRNRLTTSRIKHGLDSKNYERVLSSVLGGLYDLVGRPVIERLQSLNSRISSEQTFDKPSILLVAQPDQSLLSAFLETSTIKRLETTNVTTLMSNKATPSAVLERLRDHRFSHFVCHGKLETGKPFDASFQLHDGKRLTLLDLIRSQLPTAEFAFLSACHTAEMTEGSIADEALHLTAAMQYCGFRSVVGTMWGMADADGPELVDHFYKSMFSNKHAGTPYYERSARALRDAVRRLRKNGVPLERWVNFVHYGA